jgi:hypothetical protein
MTGSNLSEHTKGKSEIGVTLSSTAESESLHGIRHATTLMISPKEFSQVISTDGPTGVVGNGVGTQPE